MLRTCSRFIALTAMVAGPSMTAADEAATLTLACQGTTTVTTKEDAKPEPIAMGIIVDFTNHTVHGFGYPGFSGLFDFPVKITGMNEVTVAFHGSNQTEDITGSIDRVTGDVEARIQMSDSKTGDLLSILRYALKCRPTQRLF